MTKLFDGIEEKDKQTLFRCFNAVKKSFFKDEIILEPEQEIDSVIYVSNGCIKIIKDDFDGNKIIIDTIKKGETFAEAVVCSGIKKCQNFVYAQTDATLYFINIEKILNPCTEACLFHKKLLQNLVKSISEKNLFLNQRIELLTKKSLRERILIYLDKYKQKNNNKIFEIPHSREEMAQYLGVNRSALSRELCIMKAQKLIDFHKNSFSILTN